MSTEVVPSSLERTENGGVSIQWSDSTSTLWAPSELRRICPCATCKEKNKAAENDKPAGLLKVISIQEAQPLKIDAMRPVGNYAYNIQFSDGHSSGIFGFELLRKNAATVSS